MPLKSGGAVDNENLHGRSDQGLISVGKVGIYGLYAGCATAPGRVVKLDFTPPFRRMGAIVLDINENNIYDFVRVGNFLYVLLHSSPPKIVKIDLLKFEKVSTLTLSNSGFGIRMATDGIYLYTAYGPAPVYVARVRISNFTLDSTLTLPSGEEGVGPDLTIVGGYLYVQTTNFGRLVKIDSSTFTRVGFLDVRSPDFFYTPQNLGLGTDGFLYVGLNRTAFPSIIRKINLETFTKVAGLNLGVDYIPNAFASVGSKLYVGIGQLPARVVKIDLPSFTQDAEFTFETGEDYVRLQSRTLEDSSFLHLGLNTVPGKIVRVDLATFTKERTITLETDENIVESLLLIKP